MSEGGSTQEPIAIQRFPLPSKGEFTQRFVRKHTSHLELYPTLVRVTHPERTQAIIGFAGFAQSHHGRYLQAQVEPIANETDRAAIAVEWSGTTDIPEMRWRRLADYLTEYHVEKVVLFGTSFGGWEVLKGLSIFNRLAIHEGFTIPPFTVIVAVAPTSGNSLQKPPIMDRETWLRIKAVQLVGPAIVKLNGNVILSFIAKSQRQITTSEDILQLLLIYLQFLLE
jgi:hypothetical protein